MTNSFKSQVNGMTDRLISSIKQLPLEATVEMANNIKRSTPFKTGRAASHWEVNDTQTFSYNEAQTGSPSEPVKVSVGEYGGNLFIGNGVPYSKILEEFGSTTVGPGQMVAMNLDFWQEIVDNASERLGIK